MIGYSMMVEKEYDDRAEAAITSDEIIGTRIEPGVINRHPLETQIFLASIAISLKRIADSLKVIEETI